MRHRTAVTALLLVALAAAACPRTFAADAPTPPAAQVPPAPAERLATVARDLVAASPLAEEGDAAARDEAGRRLSHCETFLQACGDTIVWGEFDPLKGYDPRAYVLTEFAPMVWARMYLSQFMFPGEFSIRSEPPFQVIEIPARFRSKLDPGDYPYPLWHSPKKWRAHLNVASIILVLENGRIIAAFRNARPDAALPDRRWDGKWHWTNEDGVEQPRVALFSYLLSADNPHRSALDATYRELEGRFRGEGCMSCHAPDNPSQANPLVLLLYPNQSLGARHELVDTLRQNSMPPADAVTGAAAGIANEQLRADLTVLAERFAREGDEALAFERRTAAAASSGASAAAWRTVSDDWYSLTLAGVHAGWMRVVREDDGARFRTVNEMALDFRRDGTALDVDNYVEWIETHDGMPLHLIIAKKNKSKLTNFDIGNYSAWEKTRDGDPLGLLTSRREWEFDGKMATKIAEHNGEVLRVPRVAPGGPWLPPAAAERFIRTRMDGDARAIEYGSIDAPDELRYVTVRSSLVGQNEFAVGGTTIPVTVWRTQTSVTPSQTISHYSKDAKLVYSSSNLGVGILETRLSTKDDAIPHATAPTPPRAEPSPIRLAGRPPAGPRAVFKVHARDGVLPPLPSAGAQVVTTSEDGRTARVVVDVATTSAATNPEMVDGSMRERAPIVGSDDPTVLSLASRAIAEADGLSNMELATSSRNIVHRHFAARGVADPSMALGGAGLRLPDVGAGAAAMLCEVLRVHRIPCRVVSGLVLDDGATGDGVLNWQLWTQALVDGKWVDLDATQADRFDSGHILTGVPGVGAGGKADPDPAGFAKALGDIEVSIEPQ